MGSRQDFFDSYPGPMWIYDLETLRFLDVNAMAITELGYGRDEFLAMTIADLRLPEDIPPLLEAVKQVTSGFYNRGVSRLRTKPGGILEAEICWLTIDYNGRRAALASVRDVTYQRELEREKTRLLERERSLRKTAEDAARHFQSLFEAAPGLYIVLSPDRYDIVAVSNDFLRSTMTRREDIKGRCVFDVFPEDPKDPGGGAIQAMRDSLERVKATGMTDVPDILRHPIPLPASLGGGFEERYWSPVNTPVKGPDGCIAFIICRVEDVTDFLRTNTETTPLKEIEDRRTHLALDIMLRYQELKEANRRLQEQDANLRTAQRLLRLGLWKMNMREGQLQWSENVYEIYGVTPETFDGSFSAYVALVHPDDRDAMERNYQSFVESSAPHFDFEHRILQPGGRVVQVRGVGERLYTPKGPVLNGVVQDITAQAKAEERLNAMTTLLRIAGKAARLGGWRLTQADGLVEFSPVAAEIHDLPAGQPYPLETIIGFYVPEHQPRIHALLSECLHRGTPYDETFQVTTARGIRRWVRMVGEAERDRAGTIVAMRGGVQDVSELMAVRKQSEGLSLHLLDTLETMRISEERLRLLAKATNDVIWDWDLVKDRIWWNENIQHQFGHGFGMQETDSQTWTENIHPEDRDRIIADVTQAIDGDVRNWKGEYRFLHANGRVATVVDRGFVIRDAYGKALRMVGSMIDITERLELDDRLRLSQKLEAVCQLTGGIAHDFNNLLTVILGNAELLRDRLGDNKPLYGLADISVTAAKRGAELTSHLLAFARRQALEPQRVSINRLIEKMSGLLRRTLAENITITPRLQQDLWVVEVDPGQLEVALLNLAINARDAMPDGGCLSIETGNVEIDAAYAALNQEVEAGAYVVVSVSDTGSGMPQEVVEKAFEPFFTTKGVGKGNGLGLSMVYGFVKQSGGHIKIYSELGQGTTLRLYFPRVIQAEQPVRTPSEPLRITGGQERILVVEDDAMVRAHLVGQLEDLGYQVVAAEAGQPALDILNSGEDFDLLFTDIIMPGGMNGRQLAEAAVQLRPGLKVLFTSGYTETAIVHQGRLDPGVHLLSKPYRRKDLAAKVREVLEG